MTVPGWIQLEPDNKPGPPKIKWNFLPEVKGGQGTPIIQTTIVILIKNKLKDFFIIWMKNVNQLDVPLSCHHETVDGQDSGQNCERKPAALWPCNKRIKQIINCHSI